ncbi:MAG: hypothetical protein GF335_00590 [Candidatus Moranbacteria bacterium]|nr:hypothetical protein [Candidatus Moranbacteria bacterium]
MYELQNLMKNKIFIIFGFLLFILDQLIKQTLVGKPSFLNWDFVCNKGVAFGVEINFLFIFLSNILIIFLIIIFLIKKNQSFIYKNQIFFIIILLGAFSNLIDRALWGCVIDYIDFKIWPVFNLADVLISGSALLIVIKTFLKKT